MTPAISRMSPESEKRLFDVLEKVADLVNDGEDPNGAIVKAASEAKIPAGHIQLIVNAYNTGRTTAQRQVAGNVWEKSANFPVADASLVLEAMFPDEPKSAAQHLRAVALSDEYATPPTTFVARLQQAATTELVKAAGYEVKSPPAPKFDAGHATKLAFGNLHRLSKTAEVARHRAAVAHEAAATTIDDLARALAQPDAPNFKEAQDNCARLYGEDAHKLFEYLATRRPGLIKLARRTGQPARGEVYDLVEQCLEIKDAAACLEADAVEKKAAHDEAQEAYLRSIGKKAAVKPTHPLFGWELSAKEAADPYHPFTGMLSHAVAPLKAISDERNKAHAKLVTDAELKKPGPDPAIDDEMKQIRQRNVVQDLLSSDDVISGYDPHHVLGAYREVADVAPQAAQRGAIAKDFVRRRLAGGQLNYFDLEALTRIEKNLRDSVGKQPGADQPGAG